MPASYLPDEPQQQLLLPDALQDWLPEGHLAYFVSDSVDSLDLSAFHARYARGGPRNQPFHPAMMVKVLIYGYATGTFSSRTLAAKLHEDVALRMLAAENYPAHRTLSDFRALLLQELADLFVQVVRLARECGLVKLGTVAVDGTKLKANASRHKAMSYERMVKAEAELKEQIDGLLNRARAADDLERNEPDLDIPGEIKRREDRLDQERAGVQAVQPAGPAEGPGRVQARVPGAEPAAHEWLEGQIKVRGSAHRPPRVPLRIEGFDGRLNEPLRYWRRRSLPSKLGAAFGYPVGSFCRADS